jgi:GWxTD domain-containing protein
VEVGAVNIAALPTGIYVLEISVLDDNDQVRAASVKRFKVYNPDVEQSVQTLFDNIEAAVAASDFAFMTEKELNAEWQMIRYITSVDEKSTYDALENIENKRKYIYQFWANRDPSVMTMVNEFRAIYMKKISYANDHYRSFTRPGWKTDRGRVYMMYGLPSDVERFHNNPNAFSHEIWRYDDIEGGVEFVFADLQEYGEFMQLHSTKRGEPYNRNWQTHIRRN